MNPTTPPATRLRSFQVRVFWLLWSAYGSYYLCRLNFAVAQPALLKEFPMWTSAQIGTIPSLYAAAYAVGQVINGILGQRYGTRRLMTLAMVLAGLTNVLFAFTSSLETMRLLWAVNGLAQSAGWTLMVGTLADWNTSARRGSLLGRLSTCYTVGNVAAWLLAGWLCSAVGWRLAFLAPGLFMFPMAVIIFIFLRDSPGQAGFPPVRDDPAPDAATHADDRPANWTFTWQMIRLTLANRTLWILAIGFLAMNAVRYSFMNWTVQYLVDFHGRSIRSSALLAIVVPLAGALGGPTAGWASDALFGQRRAPVCFFMMLGLALACGALAFVPLGDWLVATGLLALAGFMIYGPDLLMSGAATVDLSHPRASAIATGLTMCFGSLGAIFSGAGIGWLKDFAHGNWSVVFGALAAMPLLPALLMLSIWNVRPRTSA